MTSQRRIGQHQIYDAVIVGARVAGAATALLLARAGRRVLLVDRAPYGADTLSTHAILRGGVLQLHRWGLLDELHARGTPAVHHTAFHYGDDSVEIAIADQHGVDALYGPRRTVLDSLLVDAARDAGVEVVMNVAVDALRRAGDGRVVGIAAQDVVADADVVIGADGAGSLVARLVDAPNCYRRTDASAFVYGYFGGLARDRFDW
jgi:menaquinone-9 beta-reductase